MNILYLAHRIPYPPNKGDKLRSFHQIEQLARSHRVWCACFIDQPEDRQHIAKLREYCVEAAGFEIGAGTAAFHGIRSLLAGGTGTCGWFRDSRMTETVAGWSRQVRFDSVVAFSSSMAPYALQVDAERRVLDLCDCDSQKWREYAERCAPPKRWLYRLEARRLAAFEKECVGRFDQTVVISQAEAALLPESQRVRVIANGVRIPEPELLEGLEHAGPGAGAAPVVGFVGALNYWPNVDAVVWFVNNCWPAIRRASPEAVFRIVGHAPARAVRGLANVAGVQVVGPVPDVAPELRRFDASVAPLRIARGLQNKVLEAMAFGMPVVLTSGAAEGIAGRSGEHFLVADEPQAFARSVIELLQAPATRQDLGRAARQLVAGQYQWRPLMREFEALVTGAPAVADHAPKAAESSSICASSVVPARETLAGADSAAARRSPVATSLSAK